MHQNGRYPLNSQIGSRRERLTLASSESALDSRLPRGGSCASWRPSLCSLCFEIALDLLTRLRSRASLAPREGLLEVPGAGESRWETLPRRNGALSEGVTEPSCRHELRPSDAWHSICLHYNAHGAARREMHTERPAKTARPGLGQIDRPRRLVYYIQMSMIAAFVAQFTGRCPCRQYRINTSTQQQCRSLFKCYI